jgi:hypothetical protein
MTNGFVLIPGKYEHWFLLPWFQVTMPDRKVGDYPRTETEFVGSGLHLPDNGSYRTKAVIFGISDFDGIQHAAAIRASD